MGSGRACPRLPADAAALIDPRGRSARRSPRVAPLARSHARTLAFPRRGHCGHCSQPIPASRQLSGLLRRWRRLFPRSRAKSGGEGIFGHSQQPSAPPGRTASAFAAARPDRAFAAARQPIPCPPRPPSPRSRVRRGPRASQSRLPRGRPAPDPTSPPSTRPPGPRSRLPVPTLPWTSARPHPPPAPAQTPSNPAFTVPPPGCCASVTTASCFVTAPGFSVMEVVAAAALPSPAPRTGRFRPPPALP